MSRPWHFRRLGVAWISCRGIRCLKWSGASSGKWRLTSRCTISDWQQDGAESMCRVTQAAFNEVVDPFGSMFYARDNNDESVYL